MYCKNCGTYLPDETKFCTNCGCPVSPQQPAGAEPVQQVQSDRTLAKKPNTGVKVFLVLCVLAGIFAMVFREEIKQTIQYTTAEIKYNQGDYIKALSIAENLDSEKAKELVIKCRYNLAAEASMKDDLQKAVEYLEGLDYEDSRNYYNLYTYNLGVDAFNEKDYKTAASYFQKTDYEDSKEILVDCNFIIDLEKSVTERLDLEDRAKIDKRKLVTTELSILEKYENAAFSTSGIRSHAEEYLEALEWQLDSLSEDNPLQAQYDWQSGTLLRYQILDDFYETCGFMADNPKFVRDVINQLDYEEKWHDAFDEITDNGHVETKKGKFTNYIELYLKNNTEYTFSQMFEFKFYKDEDEKVYLDKATVLVEDIGPYQEYTVRLDVPAAAKNNYYVSWSYYLTDIEVD